MRYGSRTVRHGSVARPCARVPRKSVARARSCAEARDRLADAPDALVDLLARDRRQRKPEVVVAAGVGEERLAEQERRAAPFRSFEQRARAHFARRRRPQIEAAGARGSPHRRGPVPAIAASRERAPFGSSARSAARARRSRAQVVRDAGLHVEARRHVVRLFAQQQPLENRARRGQPAEAQRRRDRLARTVESTRRSRARATSGGVRAGASSPYGSSSTIGTPARRASVDEPLAPVGVHRDAGRVVQRRHRVDEARTPRPQDRLDVIHAHPSSSTGTGIARRPAIWKICSAPGYVGASTMISSPGSAKLCATSVMPCVEPVSTRTSRAIDAAAARGACARRSLRAAARTLRVAVGEDEIADRPPTRSNDCASSPSGEGSAGGTPCTNEMRSPCSVAASSPRTVGKFADAPRRQADPPGNPGRPLAAARPRSRARHPRARADPLFDQAVARRARGRRGRPCCGSREALGQRPLGRQPGRLGKRAGQDRFAQILVDLTGRSARCSRGRARDRARPADICALDGSFRRPGGIPGENAP